VKHFFISYNKADRAWAEWIAWVLEEAGYSTVIQAWDFGPGSNFVLEMDKAEKEAERTMALPSPDYLASVFTQSEWAAAFAKDPTGEKRTVVPVRVRECKLEGLLAQIVYTDFVGRSEIQARESLLGVAANYSESLGAGLNQAASLLNRLGNYLHCRAQLTEAEQTLRRALAVDEKLGGPDHPDVARDSDNLGTVLIDKRDLTGALSFSQRAIAINEKRYGPDDPNVARNANHIGVILKELGDLDGALRHARRSLAVGEKVYGMNHPDVANRSNNLGTILREKGDLEAALRYMH
jgi:tetratricopeptide (TPR) repeat protein